MSSEVKKNVIAESELKEGAKVFEMAWLRPKKIENSNIEVTLRMKINKKWGGWKLKDEVVKSVGLEVGDTINTEVSILCGPGLIDDLGDTDLFASGKGADWLLENEVGKGSVIDAKVKLIYSPAPIGGVEGKVLWRLSLVFLEGYEIIQRRIESGGIKQNKDLNELRELLGS